MKNPVMTKSGFLLVSPELLVEFVRRIEASLPGWWWSISQSKESIFFNMGPGRNCPHLPDIEYAKTREGDNGRSFDHVNYLGKSEDASILSTLDKFILFFADDRKLSGSDTIPFIIPSGPISYRRQSDSDLEALGGVYQLLLETIPFIEERGHQLNQIYIGSCDLSADCSLRGKRADDSDFDISFDLQGDTSLAETMTWSISELKNDVLTPR